MHLTKIVAVVAAPLFAGDELVRIEDLQGTAVQKFSDQDFEAMKTSSFLPRLQLMTANSEKCKSGDFPTNNYALVRDQEYGDLGKSVDVLVIAWRPKAMSIGDAIVSSHDPNSDQFKDIQERAEQPNSGCMWGYEFLMWVPSRKAFVAFYCGSKSARREAPHIKARMGKAATLSSKKVEKGKFTWFTAKVSDCSTPFEMPAKEKFLAEVEKFNNPPKQTIETAQDAGDQRAQ